MAYKCVVCPEDPPRLLNLDDLGYFVDSNDKIARLENPSQGYCYLCNKNVRFVQIRHEDYEEACRSIVHQRIGENNIIDGYIPGFGRMEPTLYPTGLPQVPIYFSNFRLDPTKCDRLVLLIGKSRDDPLIHSRHLWDSHGVDTGSIVNFINHAHSQTGTGIVIANPGQPLWSQYKKTAVTYKTWDALTRHSATDNSYEITKNDFIPQNANPLEHLLCLFTQVILPTVKLNPAKPKVYIICVDDTVRVLLQFLQQDWIILKDHIGSIVSCNGYINPMEDFYNAGFIQFWSDYCKGYSLDSAPLGTPIETATGGINLFSGGESSIGENVFHLTYPSILKHFALLHCDANYKLQAASPKDEIRKVDETVELDQVNDIDAEGKLIRRVRGPRYRRAESEVGPAGNSEDEDQIKVDNQFDQNLEMYAGTRQDVRINTRSSGSPRFVSRIDVDSNRRSLQRSHSRIEPNHVSPLDRLVTFIRDGHFFDSGMVVNGKNDQSDSEVMQMKDSSPSPQVPYDVKTSTSAWWKREDLSVPTDTIKSRQSEFQDLQDQEEDQTAVNSSSYSSSWSTIDEED